jgi:hypothetical protein
VLFDGRNGGIVELLDNVLVIRRKGVASFLTQGLKGEKRIPYASIMSVQFKEAGFTTGYIQFGVGGGIESRGGVWDATTDENTVLFTKAAAEDFRRLRDIVEDRSAAARGGRSAQPQTAAPSNVAEELGRLADLKERGVLTDEEFNAQKARLLGTAPAGANPAPQPGQAAHTRDIRRLAADSPIQETRSNGIGKSIGIGCLVLAGLFFLISLIGAMGARG